MEIVIIGEKASIILMEFRKIIFSQIDGCKRNNFLLHLSQNSFISVNASTSQSIGTHCLLICRKNGDYIFADPLGQNLVSYIHLHNRLNFSAVDIRTVYELLRNQPIEKPNSMLCGLFSIYIANFFW